EPESLPPQTPVTDGVDAPMERNEPTAGQPAFDRPARQTRRPQLPPSHHPPLTRRQLRDHPICGRLYPAIGYFFPQIRHASDRGSRGRAGGARGVPASPGERYATADSAGVGASSEAAAPAASAAPSEASASGGLTPSRAQGSSNSTRQRPSSVCSSARRA